MKKRINNLLYLKECRRILRNNSTSAEAFLWGYLKGSQLKGRKFRRQHSICRYIADFYCASEKLIIELDGQGHYETGGQVYDEMRDKELERMGYKVLRFENRFVFENIEGVLDEIARQFED